MTDLKSWNVSRNRAKHWPTELPWIEVVGSVSRWSSWFSNLAQLPRDRIGYLHLWPWDVTVWSQSEHFLELSDFLFSIPLLRGFLGLHVFRRSENGRIDFWNFFIQNISRCSYLVNQFLFSQSTESLNSETLCFFSQIDDSPAIHFNIESKKKWIILEKNNEKKWEKKTMKKTRKSNE